MIKTRLQTGDMPDLFCYNSGSLFQALAPDQFLVNLADESFMGGLNETFKDGVAFGRRGLRSPRRHRHGRRHPLLHPGLRGARPVGSATWDEFMDNNQALLDAGGPGDPVLR